MNKKMQQAAPLITIIISNLNGSETLQQCIDSVADQTYKNKELIIIDGDSRDGSVDLLKENDRKITYWISEIDKGIYNAWNKGLVKANGDWICFLGSDDYFWDVEVLQRLVQFLNCIPDDIRVAYGQEMLLTKNGETLYKVGKPWDQVKSKFHKYMSIPHVGLMHRRTFFERNGIFDESFLIAGDYELLLRELKSGDAAFIPIIIAGSRQGGISCNSGNSFTLLREVRRAQLKNGFYMPSFVLLMAFIRLLIRKVVWYCFGECRARKLLDIWRSVIGLPKYWTKI